jgi:ParB/RepB/Spo0J family partition protein
MPVLEATTPLAQSIAQRAKKGGSKSIKELMQGRSDNYKLNPFDIVIEPGFNARDVNSPKVQEHIDGLAKSISAIGLQRALKVRMKSGTAFLVDGECRLRAVIRAIEVYGAEIRTVEVKLADKTMSDAEATLSLVVDNSGLDLNALEKAAVFKRLDSYGWTLNEIAERAGLSSVRVSQLIELAAVPESIKDMIRSDEIAPTLAWSISKENNFDEADTMRCIKTALAEAKGQGRKRVTARHVAGTRTSIKQTVTSILRECTPEDCGEDGIVLAFTRDQFDALQQALKLNLL